MESSSIRLGSIGGIPVGASWTLPLIGLVLGVGLAQGRFPSTHHGYGDGAYWIAAGVTVVAFFASILAHEMGHALVARARGLEVDGVTLWFLGGVTRMHGLVDGPATDAGVAAIGPLTSGALAAGFAGAGALAGALDLDPLVVAVCEWLALINAALAAFNALPAAPLDGGSVLAAAVWWRTGDRAKGRRVAATGGQVLGGLLLAYGLWSVIDDRPESGIWTLMIGWFIFQGASAEQAAAETPPRSELAEASMAGRDFTIADLIPAEPLVLECTTTVDEMIGLLGSIGAATAFAVRDRAGVVSAAVLVADLQTVAPAVRSTTTAEDLAISIASQCTAWATETRTDIAGRLAERSGVRFIAVYDRSQRLVGVVTGIDVARHVHRPAPPPPPAGGRPPATPPVSGPAG